MTTQEQRQFEEIMAEYRRERDERDRLARQVGAQQRIRAKANYEAKPRVTGPWTAVPSNIPLSEEDRQMGFYHI